MGSVPTAAERCLSVEGAGRRLGWGRGMRLIPHPRSHHHLIQDVAEMLRRAQVYSVCSIFDGLSVLTQLKESMLRQVMCVSVESGRSVDRCEHYG